ncbi:hypothetical protein D3C71_1010330 [compost metagenome]
MRDAVDLHLVDEEAAHVDVVEAGAGVVGLDGHAGDLTHGVLQAVQVLVVHALARDDGHRLRDVLELDVAFADGDFIGGVGVRAFGGRPQRHAGDGRRTQLQCTGVTGRWHQRHGVAIQLKIDAAPQQQGFQCLFRFHVAGHRRGLDAVDHVLAVENLQVGLLAQLAQCTGQRLSRYIDVHRGCLDLGRTQQQQGQQRARHDRSEFLLPFDG